MALFKIKSRSVTKLTTTSAENEKQVQNLFEENLDTILNVTFLASEYSTSFGGRIDTLGIDKNGSPAIIEYKKTQNDNVINQGLSYLRWLLDHKADFEMLCGKNGVNLEIDWDSPRVICVAESFNKFDLDTADILPINVELLKYRIYGDNLLQVESETFQKIRISTTGIEKRAKQIKQKGETLQKTYSIDYHLRKASGEIKNIFYSLRENITSLDENIKEEPKKFYIAYKLSTNFVDIEIRSKDIKIFLNMPSGQLNDTFGIARDLTKPKIGHWGNGDYEVKIQTNDAALKAFELIKQSYNFNK